MPRALRVHYAYVASSLRRMRWIVDDLHVHTMMEGGKGRRQRRVPSRVPRCSAVQKVEIEELRGK